MSTFSVDQADLTRVQSAMQALLSPLESPSVDAWRREVNRQVGDLLGADQRSFLLPAPGMDPFYSEQVDQSVLSRYPEVLRPLDERLQVTQRVRQLQVANRRATWGSNLPILYRSVYYNEYIVPARAFDPLTLLLPPLPDGPAPQLLFHHASRRGRRFGRRGLGLAKLLFPSFRAGVRAFVRLQARRTELASALDALSEGAVLMDLDGTVLHRNPEGSGYATKLHYGAEVEAAVAKVGDVVRNALRRPSRKAFERGAFTATSTVVPTPEGALVVSGALLGGASFGGRRYVLVLISRRRAPDMIQRRGREAGLTRRQAQVAALLARRRTNEEIASALCVSPATARRHTEDVLAHLGVRSRRQVEARLLGGLAQEC